jgi:hypothetical protein
VFLLRHAKRLPFGKRTEYDEVKAQHEASPIDSEIVWRFCQEMQSFVSAIWYEPEKALERGSFVLTVRQALGYQRSPRSK